MKEKLVDVTKQVASELSQAKGYSITTKPFPDFDEFSLGQKPYSISSRLTADDIKAKIDAVFAANQVQAIPYQFGLRLQQ